ncbi:MAG: trigger factor [Coriobacteriia bacterium]|nr:trigger factor [Coriobacteriia bacterium]
MEITKTNFEDDGQAREIDLTLVASAEEVDEYIKLYLKDLSNLEVPGFRKGKAPRKVIEQGVGGHEAFMGGAAEKLINSLAFKCIDDADILFIEEPEFNVSTVMEDGKPFSFSVSGKVPPVMELTDYEPVSIEMPPDEATEAEINRHIDNLRDYYHTFEDITDESHAAEMGDYAMLNVTITTAEGGRISGLTEVDRLVGLGKGTMPASFDEHIIGATKGMTLSFDFKVEGEMNRPEFGDGNLHANVEVMSFRKCIVPELDDAFAQKLGAEDVHALTEQVKNALNNDKNRYLPQLMEERVVDALIKRIDGPVPEYYVDFIRQDVGREMVANLDKEGTSLQDWILRNDVQREELKENIQAEALNRAVRDCALEAMFKHQGWEVTDKDVEDLLQGTDNPEETLKSWQESNHVSELRKMCRQNMVIRWLVKTAEVTVVEEAE